MTRGPPLTQRPAALQTTFFRAWPKNKGSFLMYGRSVHTQRREVTEALLMQEPMETAADKSGAARPQRSGFMKSLAQALHPATVQLLVSQPTVTLARCNTAQIGGQTAGGTFQLWHLPIYYLA